MEILASQARICLPLREIETGGWSGSILMLSRLALLGPPVSVAIQERVNSKQLDQFRQPHHGDQHRRDRLRHAQRRPPTLLSRHAPTVDFNPYVL